MTRCCLSLFFMLILLLFNLLDHAPDPKEAVSNHKVKCSKTNNEVGPEIPAGLINLLDRNIDDNYPKKEIHKSHSCWRYPHNNPPMINDVCWTSSKRSTHSSSLSASSTFTTATKRLRAT